ncbi:MAG: PLD nuclease N-terminal domain-containing protein [Methanolobus sp.]
MESSNSLSVIWVVYDVITQNKRLNSTQKFLWIVIAIIFNILGAVAYYFLGKK